MQHLAFIFILNILNANRMKSIIIVFMTGFICTMILIFASLVNYYKSFKIL